MKRRHFNRVIQGKEALRLRSLGRKDTGFIFKSNGKSIKISL
jgi:hypothetical protein